MNSHKVANGRQSEEQSVRDGFRLEQLSEWSQGIQTSNRMLGRLGMVTMVLVFGLGGGWAATAPIGGAVQSTGRVIASGTNPVAQHEDGGTIREILVKEGDKVELDQVMARLDRTKVQSALSTNLIERAMKSVALQRWWAESQGLLTFDVDLSAFGDAANDDGVVGTLAAHNAEFAAARDARAHRFAIIQSDIASSQEDIAALEDVIRTLDQQIGYANEQVVSLRRLRELELTTQTLLLDAESFLAELEGRRSQAVFEMNKAQHGIISLGQEAEAVRLEAREVANQNITKIQTELNEIANNVAQLEYTLDNLAIRAPADGVVFSMHYTKGAVLPGYDTFAEIFPEGETLLVESQVQPKDIAQVSIGQTVNMIFSSEREDNLIPVSGTVEYISTDSFQNPDTGSSYFVVRSSIDGGQEERTILPGNEPSVYFNTEPKTFFVYVAEPLTKFAMRSFSE